MYIHFIRISWDTFSREKQECLVILLKRFRFDLLEFFSIMWHDPALQVVVKSFECVCVHEYVFNAHHASLLPQEKVNMSRSGQTWSSPFNCSLQRIKHQCGGKLIKASTINPQLGLKTDNIRQRLCLQVKAGWDCGGPSEVTCTVRMRGGLAGWRLLVRPAASVGSAP